LTFEDKIESKP